MITPFGGRLVDLMVGPEGLEDLTARAMSLASIQLSTRAACDLECLATGAFSPVDRFMTEADYHRVVHEMRLLDGHIFPIPLTLPVNRDAPVSLDQDVAVRDSRNELLGVMTVEEAYTWDREQVAKQVFGTEDVRHPLVAEMHGWGETNISGRIQLIRLPRHHDFRELRLTPAETRVELQRLGRNNVVAFQTRNPLHRAHEEMTKRAIEETDGVLLLHPVVGMTKPGDVDHYTRVRTYKVLTSRYYEPDRVLLALLPLAMRLAGPREALWHAVIRRNYGANYLIVGRDHASPGLDSQGRPFYLPYEAQALVERFQDETGVSAIPFEEMVYVPEQDNYEELSQLAGGTNGLSLSGTDVRERYLDSGEALPGWFTRPEVAEILVEAHPPRYKQGVCIWFTGLPASGKSTTAEVLTARLMEYGRQVTLLDGDVVRTHLSRGLGFGREDRDTNIRRIGFVAAEIVRHGGVVVCAAVSPYRATRNDVRNMVGSDQFVEVFVNTPLEVCEARDTKGMYARARRGEIQGFTGIDDPYESPEHAEIVLDGGKHSASENAGRIIDFLLPKGFLLRNEAAQPTGLEE